MDPPREHDPTNALISPGTTTGVQSVALGPQAIGYSNVNEGSVTAL